MKHIKKFESLDEPQVGDYVACEESWMFAVSEFISNNVGIFKFKYDFDNSEYAVKYDFDNSEYVIEYDNIPEEFLDYFDHLESGDCRDMTRDEIKFWSKDKSEVEDYIEAKKYNL